MPEVESREDKEIWDSFEDVLVTDTIKTVHEESDEEDYPVGESLRETSANTSGFWLQVSGRIRE